MTPRELADSLIRETQDMRWQAARDVIEAALLEQYRIGFLDGGEMAGKADPDREVVEGCAF